jgi:hypothetical protein
MDVRQNSSRDGRALRAQIYLSTQALEIHLKIALSSSRSRLASGFRIHYLAVDAL